MNVHLAAKAERDFTTVPNGGRPALDHPSHPRRALLQFQYLRLQETDLYLAHR